MVAMSHTTTIKASKSQHCLRSTLRENLETSCISTTNKINYQ
jgi:hypothetical protein